VTPAFLAAKNGNLDIFKMLHEHGADIEGVSCSIGGNQDLEPIHIAAKSGNALIVMYIVNKSPNMAKLCQIQITQTMSTPLHLTAYDGHTECAITLLDSGAPLLFKNKYGDTVFHIAIRHGHLDYVR